MNLVTITSANANVLREPTKDILPSEMTLARKISDQLMKEIQAYLPAAGLAAPQIGISRSVFIYSYDRNPEHFETIINPSYQPRDNNVIEAWEACLSCIHGSCKQKVAKLKRYATIEVTYSNLKGEKVQKKLDGFAAKAFQHETDHLHGMINIEKPGAEVKSFDSEEEFSEFFMALKKNDALGYNKLS